MNNSERKCICPNIVWTIIILSLIIIALFVFILSKRVLCANQIKIFIEYAATLLSITLSIFAIAFTYTSNNTIQRQFDKIDYASRKIIESSNSLYKSEDEITKHIKRLLERVEDIKSEVGFIKNKIPDSSYMETQNNNTFNNAINRTSDDNTN